MFIANLNKFSIYLILFFALVLRLINTNQSLWLDEAISALAARDYSFYGIIFEFLKGDNHPPLFYLILRAWGLVFGFSDIALRFLPIIFGTATIWVTYLFLKKLLDQKTALLGSFLLATSPLHIYYSQEIRMYPILGFWVILLMYLFTYLVKEAPKKWLWIVFSIFLIILIATDYVGVFLLPVFFLIGYKEKVSFKKLILAFIPLGIVLIGWLPILIKQSETAKIQLASLPRWSALAGGATIKEAVVLWMKFVLGRITFYPKIIYYLSVGLFSLPILLAFYKTFGSKKSYWLWIFLIIPLIGSFLFSFIVPAFNYFRFIYVLPAFYGLIVLGSFQLGKRIQVLLLILAVIGNLFGTGLYFFDESNQREQWKQAVFYIETNEPELVVFEFPEPFAPYYWYSNGKVEGFGGLTSLTSVENKTNEKLNTKITPKTRKLMYVTYLRDLTDSEAHIQNTLVNLGFEIAESKSYSGVGEVITYERN